MMALRDDAPFPMGSCIILQTWENALSSPRHGKPRQAAADLDALLARLGERVRMMRSRRGMSRKVLARHSKVSERYLAQLESGSGNFSIVLLRRVAHAIGVPLREAVDER